jgi:hypothetical protein
MGLCSLICDIEQATKVAKTTDPSLAQTLIPQILAQL